MVPWAGLKYVIVIFPDHIYFSFKYPAAKYSAEHTDIKIYQSPPILTELFQHDVINVFYLTACYLYQVMMTLHL